MPGFYLLNVYQVVTCAILSIYYTVNKAQNEHVYHPGHY